MNKTRVIIPLAIVSIILFFEKCSEKTFKKESKSFTTRNIIDKCWNCSLLKLVNSDSINCFKEKNKDSLLKHVSTGNIGLIFNSNGNYEEIIQTRDIQSNRPAKGSWENSSDTIKIKYSDGINKRNFKLLFSNEQILVLKQLQ